jgi:hypothetical protein
MKAIYKIWITLIVSSIISTSIIVYSILNSYSQDGYQFLVYLINIIPLLIGCIVMGLIVGS